MAAIENLEIIVDVDIGSAVAKLEDLQEELQDVGEAIEAVDQIGTEGIDVRTKVDDLDTELAEVKAEIETFEATESIDIDLDITGVEKEIAEASAKIEAAETTQSFDVTSDIGTTPRLPAGDLDFDSIPSARMSENVFDDWMMDMAEEASGFGSPLDLTHANLPRGFGLGQGRDERLRPDIFTRLRHKASNAADSLSNLTGRLDNVDLRMSDLHNLLAALVPILIVFLGTIPALITAFVGLAAAAAAAAASLGAIGAFGAMGVAMEDGQFQMENLTEIWEDIRNDFIDAFAPLAERLEPLFRGGIDALGTFFQQIANQGDALLELTNEAQAFGGFVMDFAPMALRAIAGIAEALAPIMSNIGAFIQENFTFAMRELARLTALVTPAVSQFVLALMDAIPTLVEISTQFVVVATMVLHFLGALWELITLFGILDGSMGFIVAGLLTLVSVVIIARKAMLGFAASAVWTAITALYNFFLGSLAAAGGLSVLEGTAIAAAANGLTSLTAGLIKSIASFAGFSIAAITASKAAAIFWTAATAGVMIGLVGLIGSLTTSWLSLSDGIDQATSSLKEFDRVSGRTNGGFNPYGGDPPDSGAGAANPNSGNQTVINVESRGNESDARSDGKYISWRNGRTTGGEN